MNMKRTILIIGGLIVAIIAAITFFAKQTSTVGTISDLTASITTRVTPTEGTKITMNGKTVKEGKVALAPGKYTVEVSHENFDSQTREVVLYDGDNATVAVALTGKTDIAQKWYGTHPDDASKAEGITGTVSRANAENLLDKYPFLKRMPVIVANKYRIDYTSSVKSPNDPSKFSLHIRYATEPDKQAALNWIRYQGYDPAQLEITYKSLDSGHFVPN